MHEGLPTQVVSVPEFEQPFEEPSTMKKCIGMDRKMALGLDDSERSGPAAGAEA